MALSREQVQFGVVPGLASLAQSLGNAFRHAREREFELEKLKLLQGEKTRAADLKAAEDARKRQDALGKRSDVLTQKARTILPGVGEAPEDMTAQEEGAVSQLSALLPSGPAFEGVPTEEELTKQEAERASDLRKIAQIDAPPEEDPQRLFVQQQAQDVRQMIANLNALKEQAQKKRAPATAANVDRALAGLSSGGVSLTNLNTDLDGDGDTVFQELEKGLLQETMQPGELEEMQTAMQSLQALAQEGDPLATERLARGREVSPLNADPAAELDRALQFAENNRIASQPAFESINDLLAQQGMPPLPVESRDPLRGAMTNIDDRIEQEVEQAGGSLAQALGLQADMRRTVAQEVAAGKSVFQALDSVDPAFGRNSRVRAFQDAWRDARGFGGRRTFDPDHASRRYDFALSQAQAAGMSGAQADFLAMARASVGGKIEDADLRKLAQSQNETDFDTQLMRLTRGDDRILRDEEALAIGNLFLKSGTLRANALAGAR